MKNVIEETTLIFSRDNSVHWRDVPPSYSNKEPNGYNVEFVCTEMAHLACLAKLNGYIFLSDIVRALGMRPCSRDQIYGWITKPDVVHEAPSFSYDIVEYNSFVMIVLYNATKIYKHLDKLAAMSRPPE